MMKKGIIWVLGVILLISFSCKKEKKEPERQVQPLPVPEAQVEGKIISPESYFNFEKDRLSLQKDFQSKLLSLLKSTKKYDEELEGKISQMDQEGLEQFSKIQEKHNIVIEDIKRTIEDEASRNSLQEYLNGHPEVKSDLEKTWGEIEEQAKLINLELNRLAPPPQPGAEALPATPGP